ncbi:hypothetical protein ACWGA9_40765 [Streptomyces sp. NPDC054950]
MVTPGIALGISRIANRTAHQSKRAAEQANATADSVAQIERDRWQYEMTPRFDVTMTRLRRGSDQASLIVTFEGPPALERLDEIEIEIRDDGYTHGVGLAGGPDEQQIAQTIWGPYRFQPGINDSSADGRLSPAVPLELGEWLKRSLEQSFPPSWTDRAHWSEQYAGAPVRLWVRCRREGYKPWTLTYNVEVTDPQ